MDKTIDYELKRGDMTRLLREMEVGDVLRLGIDKLATVRNVISNGLIVERANGRRWKVNFDLANKQTIVTRLD